jgi:hypothetical protein
MKIVIAVLVALAVIVTVTGCDYFQDPEATPNPNDPRSAKIGGIITGAIDSLHSYGVEGLYQFMATDVTLICTKDQLAADLADAVLPARLKEIKTIKFDSASGGADVGITVITNSGDVDQTWKMILAPNGQWRIRSMPAMSDCLP